MAAAFAAARTTPGASPPVGSIPQIIGTVNGQQWLNRWEHMNKFSMPAIVRQHTNLKQQNCNTGKNMTRALQYGGPGTEAFGIEYSSDSVAIAREAHGADHAFQGDASTNF